MAQHDYNIANQSGAAFRADLNNALLAIVSQNSGTSAPSTTFAHQLWADTTTSTLKIRNAANSAWIELMQLDGTLTMEDGTALLPGLAFRDDLNTGLFSDAADTLGIATNGVERVEFGTSAVVFNDGGNDVDFRIEGDTNANLFFVDAGNDRVGIGTSSPGATLDVAGVTVISPDGTNTKKTFEFTSNAQFDGRLFIRSDTTTKVDIQANGSSFFNGGNVGIGTTSPTSLGTNVTTVEVQGAATTRSGGIRLSSSDSSQKGAFYIYDGAAVLGTETSHPLGLYVGNTERARIDSSGRLLVGTSSSSYPALLQVSGNTTSSIGHGILQLRRGNNATTAGDDLGAIWFGDGLGGNRATIEAMADAAGGTNDLPSRLVFSTTADGAASPTERMRITNDGSFAFGRTIAREFFDINGKVIINHAGTSNQNLFALATNPTHGVAMLLDNAGTSTGRTFVLSCARTASSAWRFLECNSGNNATTVGGDAEFRLDGDGNGYADNNWNSGGADYAEYFEWSDGNTNAEDRRGISVVLDGDKIREAVAGEDPIGVISGNPSVVGDSGWNKWSGKHLRDDFNSYLREEYSVIEWIDKEGTTKSYPSDDVPEDEIIPVDAITKTVDDKGNLLTRRVLNPDFDPDREYIPREQRFEWDCVGLMGKLRIRKGQVTGSRWIKMRDISDSVEEWLVR